MESGLNSLKGLFENIIYLLGSLFGFLPLWCQGLIGTAFAFMFIVFMLKLIGR